MQDVYLVGGLLLLVVVILLVVFAPSMRERGFVKTQDKAQYEIERNTPTDDVERHRRRYHY